MSSTKTNKIKYHIANMDCPCEERLVRMKLSEVEGIRLLSFDLNERTLTVTCEIPATEITPTLESLNLGTHLLSEETTDDDVKTDTEEDKTQRKILIQVLVINAVFFVLETVFGYIADSMGLVADGLDMLADALVYGMSLAVVGATVRRKKRVAMWCGIIQLTLAVIGLWEVLRRFLGMEEMPHYIVMISVSGAALIANALCLWLLQRSHSIDAHMKASVIFSANDVIINLGVIAAALMVHFIGSGIPDLVVGLIIFCIVISGALRILKLSK